MAISTIGSNSLNQTSDLTINGVTVGKGGGSVTQNTVVGASAGSANTTGKITAVGYLAARFNTTGSGNTAIGGNDGAQDGALYYNTTGGQNIAVGTGALSNNTTASNNTAVGYQAGNSNTTGIENVFVGNNAGSLNTTGNYNCFVGRYAGANTTTGVNNTYVGGQNAGYLMTTGSKNTLIGAYNGNQSGLDIRTSSNFIVLSDGDGNLGYVNANGSNFFGTSANTAPAPGYGANAVFVPVYDGTVRPGMRMYNTNTGSSTLTEINFNRNGSSIGSINTTTTTTSYVTSSDYRLKENIMPMTGALNKVAQLKPVTYTWKKDQSDGEGFIAHELAEVCPHAVSGEKDGVDKDGNPIYQGIDTSFLVATLTAAIQELKAINDQQAETINALTARIVALEAK